MSGIGGVFSRLKARGEGALIGYVMCGDPDPKSTPAIAEALIQGSVDILELGLPFSDPIADGPTIQAASSRALEAGTTPKTVLETVEQIKKKHDTPVVVMTYFNPVFNIGLDKFCAAARQSGVNGLIVPDLPVEEADDYLTATKATGLDTIFLAAPSTRNDRLSRIVACSSGFLYLVSHFGVTGAKADVADSTLNLVKRVLQFTSGRIPLAVGFGVSKPQHVKAILDAGADGVIVGSALVNIIAKNQNNIEAALEELTETVRTLKAATSK